MKNDWNWTNIVYITGFKPPTSYPFFRCPYLGWLKLSSVQLQVPKCQSRMQGISHCFVCSPYCCRCFAWLFWSVCVTSLDDSIWFDVTAQKIKQTIPRAVRQDLKSILSSERWLWLLAMHRFSEGRMFVKRWGLRERSEVQKGLNSPDCHTS